jgi:hypothetical protein
MTIRILIVDDHSVVREGLRMFLGRDPELKIVDEAANGAEAIEKARYWRPDVMLMDLLIPVIDGITATAIIRLFSLPFYHTSAFCIWKHLDYSGTFEITSPECTIFASQGHRSTSVNALDDPSLPRCFRLPLRAKNSMF